MNNQIKRVVADTAICLRHVDTLRAFLTKEAEGLREILALFGEYDAADAVADLVGLCGGSGPDIMAIGVALEMILHALEEVPFLVLEHVAHSGQGPRDLHAAMRWYGGRLADLSGEFTG